MKIGKYLVDDNWNQLPINHRYGKIIYEKKMLFSQDNVNYKCSIWVRETSIRNSDLQTIQYYLWFSCNSIKATYISIYGDEFLFPCAILAMDRADSFLNKLHRFAAFL
jgi:hypothetical protein